MQTAACPVGVGYKPAHFAALSAMHQPVDFLEIHAENYMGPDGVPQAQLEALGRIYALSVHGVGLSLCGNDTPNRAHLARLRALCAQHAPVLVSEHLAWSSHGGMFLNDLLPLPYTEAVLSRVAGHVDEVQAVLGRRILIEKPSRYLEFSETTMTEAAFLAELCRRTGCGVLLDVANVFVSATNLRRPVAGLLDELLAALPEGTVGEIHISGPETVPEPNGATMLLDTHAAQAPDAVWALLRRVLAVTGRIPTLVEWDNDVPEWPALLAEAAVARRHAAAALGMGR